MGPHGPRSPDIEKAILAHILTSIIIRLHSIPRPAARSMLVAMAACIGRRQAAATARGPTGQRKWYRTDFIILAMSRIPKRSSEAPKTKARGKLQRKVGRPRTRHSVAMGFS